LIIISWIAGRFEELIVAWLVKKFATICRTRCSIATLIRSCLQLVFIPSQMNKIHVVIGHLFKVHLNIIPFTPWLSPRNSVSIYYIDMSHPCSRIYSLFSYANSFCWRVSLQTIKQSILRIFPTPLSSPTLSLQSKYSPQQPVLRHLQFTFFPYSERQGLIEIKKYSIRLFRIF
jgi:hypothetical protein